MKRVFQKSRNFKQAEEWDILQHVRMTPEQRQKAAEQLRNRVYGKDVPDVREAHRTGLAQLIANKETIGRPKALEDLKYLKKAKEDRPL
jgi:hypothetical protein